MVRIRRVTRALVLGVLLTMVAAPFVARPAAAAGTPQLMVFGGTAAVGQEAPVTAVAYAGSGTPAPDVDVSLYVTAGPNADPDNPVASGTTLAPFGFVSFAYAGSTPGVDTVEARSIIDGVPVAATGTVTWVDLSSYSLTLEPFEASPTTGTPLELTATFLDGETPVAGASVLFNLPGQSPAVGTTDANGVAHASYTRDAAIQDELDATAYVQGLPVASNTIFVDWQGPQPGTITSAGPLTTIETTSTLNCAVQHAGDAAGSFFADTACGTFLAVGGTVYGPSSIPAGPTPVAFTPVSQNGPTGAGTAADPYRLVTVVDAGATGLRVTQTDTYVVGEESYRTDVTVTGSTAETVRIYRAADCFLQDSDSGYGAVDVATGAVACTASQDAGARLIQWLPLSTGSHHLEDGYSNVWAAVMGGEDFADTCACDVNIDNGAGLSWARNVPADGSATVSHITTFSPFGKLPLSVTKVAAQPQVQVDGQADYTITVTNPNGASLLLETITDTLPTGFTYVSGSSTAVTADDPSIAGRTLTWTGPFVAPGHASVTLSFSATVGSTPGTFTNSADATVEGYTVVGSGPTAPVQVTSTPPESADLVVSIDDSPDPVATGGDVTYSVTVANDGPNTASAVQVRVPEPEGAAFVSATGDATATCDEGLVLGAAQCSAATLAAGASFTVEVVLTAPSTPGTLSVTATASSGTNDPDLGNDAATALTTVGDGPVSTDLAVSLADAPDPVASSGAVTYTATVENLGDADAPNVVLAFDVPAGTLTSVTPDQGTCGAEVEGVVTCDLGTLAPGSTTVAFAMTAPTGPATMTALATVSSVDVSDPNGSNDAAQATTSVLAPPQSADLEVSMFDFHDPVLAGDGAVYQVDVANAGPDAATNVVATATVPEGGTFAEASAGCSEDAGTITCDLGTIAAGGFATFTYEITAPLTATTFSTTASASADQPDPNSENDSATETTDVVEPPADVVLSPMSATSVVGTTRTMTATVTFHGEPLSGISVDFGATRGISVIAQGNDVTDANGDATFQFTNAAVGVDNVVANAFVDGEIVSSAVAAITWEAAPPPGPDVAISSADTPDPVTVGQKVRYTLTVANTGSSTATGVSVAETVPAGATFAGIVTSQGTCSAIAPITCTLGSIAAGGTVTIQVLVTAPGAPTTITNVASVTSTSGDPNPANDTTSQTTTVIAAPGGGGATGFVPPGGSISTGTVPSPSDPTVATLTLPNSGPGAVITLLETTSSTFCLGPCDGSVVTVLPFVGYDDPNQPVVLRIAWDRSIAAPRKKSTIWFRKEGDTVSSVLPDCRTRDVAIPAPCLNDLRMGRGGDLTAEILLLSTDPSFAKR